MKKAAVVLISVLLVVFQVTVTNHFKIGWLNYNFALMSVVMATWIFDNKSLAYCNALITGLALDLFWGEYFGYNALLFLGVVTLLLFLSGQMYKRSFAMCLMLSFFSTAATEFITYIIFCFSQGYTDNAFFLSKIIFPQGLVNCIPGVIVYFIYVLMDNKMKIRKRW